MERYGTKLKLPFGLHNDKLVTVSEVERGLACECVCPACAHPLIARKGEERIHHFAHSKGEECEYAVESAIHLAAKEILAEHKRIYLPPVTLQVGAYEWTMYDGRMLEFTEVESERRLGGIIPDILIHQNGRSLIVEIAVSHQVDKEKVKKIEALGISTIEISLQVGHKDFWRGNPFERVKKELINSAVNRRWVFNAKENAVRQRIYALAETKHVYVQWPYVRACPIQVRRNEFIHLGGRTTGGSVQRCYKCLHLVEVKGEPGLEREILCTGNHPGKIREILRDKKEST